MNYKLQPLKKYIYLSFILTLTVLLNACSKGGGSGSDPCNGLSFKFSTDVQPIINTTCAINSSCHATGSTNSGGPLTDHGKILAKTSQIKFQVENGLMPKTGSLTTTEKNKIICWINSGAPNN